MRRILTTALASSLLALALPAAASAHHHGRHHRHHHRHHARTVVFARHSTTPANTTPATESVATIASFENGVLKITLADGSTVSGKVTEMTEIECGGGCSGHHDFGGGSPGWQHDNGDDGWEHHDGGPSRFHDDHFVGPQDESSCGVSALVAGAKVKEAELHVSGAGAFWEKVELLPNEEKA
jgi:hypothetical protein